MERGASIRDPEAARGRTLGSLALVGVLVAPGVLAWLLSRPIPAAPLELPPLVLAPALVAAQLDEDARAASAAPSSAAAEARREAYRAVNEGELDPSDRPALAEQRHALLASRLTALEGEHGAAALDATRAQDLERAMRALRGEAEGLDRGAELGAFPVTLESYGMVHASRQLAPQFVVRTAFKARWNAAHGRAPTETLSPIERQAYWGWLALAADAVPSERRLEGLAHYAEAGGAHVDEARAVLLLEAGRREEAAEAFEAAARAHPTFRLRNLALGARLE